MIVGTFDTNAIVSPSIQEYFEEVLANYMDGHNRSAIVLLYSTVVTDLMQKLKDLSDNFNDSSAASILTDVATKKAYNPTDPSWENDVIKGVLKKSIVSTEVALKVEQLQQQRHPLNSGQNVRF